MVEMQHLLQLWIEYCNPKQIPVSLASIQVKWYSPGNWKRTFLLPVKAGLVASEDHINWLTLSYLVTLEAHVKLLLWNLYPESKNYRQPWLCT